MMSLSAQGAEKKVIEFGWDEPTTAFMRAHITDMEKMPFDGTVFTVHATNEAGKQDFLSTAWGHKTFSAEDFTKAIDDLRATKFDKFTDNFARFDVTPGDVDWFDDFSAIKNNARQIARVAKIGGAKGVLFDIEQYASPLWDYSKQPTTGKKRPFAVYAAKARIRGHEVMEAFQSEYPGITVFLTFGYSLPWEEMQVKKDKLSDVHYGLMAPFLNGMIEAAEGNTKIVDGFEVSYGWRKNEFPDGYREMREGVLPIVADPAKYAKVVSAGFGLWMDYDWRKTAWDTKDFSRNHFTPEQFEKSLTAALARSDEYVWVYTEKPWWWGPEGSKELPDAYISAVRSARGR